MHIHFTACRTRRMYRYFSGCAFIVRLIADAQQKLGKFHYPARNLFGLLLIRAAFKHRWPMVLHHAATRTRWHNNQPRLRKQIQLRFCHFKRILRMPRRKGRLTTAALFHRKMYTNALLFNQGHRIHARFRHKNIQQTCTKKINISRLAAE